MTRSSGVAGLVLAGFEGPDPDSGELRALEALGVGGYILFGRNVESPDQVHRLLGGIRERAGGRPLLFAVDQEGGRVARLRAPLTEWPPMARLGASADVGLARDVGAALGRELGALGFNLDFAPVLDLRYPHTTDAIGDRSLGSDPARVARLGRALIEGLQGAGILACAKHFPGHGHVEVDSHERLPTCSLSAAQLRSADLQPFAEAIAGGVASVMTAHVVYPALDDAAPATLSRAILTDLLRSEMGFEGPIFTDDLGMGAISEIGSTGEAAVRAVRAGADGLLVCRHLHAVEEVTGHLQDAAAQSPDFALRCRQSCERLVAAADRFPPVPAALDRLPLCLGVEGHQVLARRVQAEADAPIGTDPTGVDTGQT